MPIIYRDNPSTCAERLSNIIAEFGGRTSFTRMLGKRSVSMWNKYLSGKSNVGEKLGAEIESATGIRKEWLMHGELPIRK